jgi:hypothetical protein
MTNLPAPEQWLLVKMSEAEVAEMIEKYINFVDKDGTSVRLQSAYVRHYMRRDDGVLPTVVAITTTPIVLGDGYVVGREEGLDRLRGIEFHVQPEVSACVPQPGTVSDADVEQAMRFLLDDWLVDVAADFAGKCVIIAAALSIIERSLLDQRPTFWVTAGRRGGGKTTTLIMLITAVTGIWPSAAAWSDNEEERRKALLSYFMYGVPYILWDNIPRGERITCPHIERSCTAAYYADRKLGVSEMVATAASTIHLFTGNNIKPKGDLASRSLEARLTVDRPDPENREFRHPDIIDWTEAHRAELLRAFYTILMGNPTLKLPHSAPMKTRFKVWWRLIGSAVEHAAKLMADHTEPGAFEPKEWARPVAIAFKDLFLKQDAEDEDSNDLADVLDILYWEFPTHQFTATDVAEFINKQKVPVLDEDGRPECDPFGNLRFENNLAGATVRDFLYPKPAAGFVPTPKSVGKQLGNHLDDPVQRGEDVLTLRMVPTRACPQLSQMTAAAKWMPARKFLAVLS